MSARFLLLGAAAGVAFFASQADAYRMIRNTSTGRFTSGTSVSCTDGGGFTHWTKTSIAWRLNPANQGSRAGMESAFSAALASWSNVSPAGYVLSYAGTTNQGFTTDGTNTVSWSRGTSCVGSCLALTALVLSSGQVITESDFVMNDAAAWNSNGADYDAQSIMAHELGHSLGIHHTEVKKRNDRPTMYSQYFGADGRSLSSDDQAALNCAYQRYPPSSSSAARLEGSRAPSFSGAMFALSASPRAGGGVLFRIFLPLEGQVSLDVFDVSGRLVTNVMEEWRGAGQHEVAWDGSARSGEAAPGVYFARARSGGEAATATAVRIR